MTRLLRGIFSCIAFLYPVVASAGGRTTIRLTSLVTESDLIVVGSLSGNAADSSNSSHLIINSGRILKGVLDPLNEIQVQRPLDPSSSCHEGIPVKPVTAIWFLKSNQDGTYSLLRDSLPTPCVPENTLFEVNEVNNVNDVFRDGVRPNSTVDKIALELGAEVWRTNGDAPQAFVGNSAFLLDASIPVQRYIYRRWEAASADRVRMLGLVGLIAIGDAEAIRSVADGRQDYRQIELPTKALLNGEYYQVQTSVLGFNTYEGPVAQVLANVANVKNPTSDTIAALGAVGRNSALSLQVRQSAAQALRVLHSKDAATELQSLLSSDEADLRAEALAGISQYAAGVPSQASPTPLSNTGSTATLNFSATGDANLVKHVVVGPGQINSQNEKDYLQYWTEWSKTHLPIE